MKEERSFMQSPGGQRRSAGLGQGVSGRGAQVRRRAVRGEWAAVGGWAVQVTAYGLPQLPFGRGKMIMVGTEGGYK